jgi:hypothetical protein
LSAPVAGEVRSAGALQRAIRGSYPGIETRTRERGLERVRRSSSARGIGVRQSFRREGSSLLLSTRLSRRARERMPALATALRRNPTAVLVRRTELGTVLHGPVRETASGPVYDRIHVSHEGVTTVRLVDARTGRIIPGTRTLASRDWTRHPAIVERAAAPLVYAVSDVHGDYDRLVGLLTTHGLVERGSLRWTGGRAKLVVVGDLINRGPRSVAVIDLLRSLQVGAAARGGEVIATLGNHEASFLLEPDGGRAAKRDGIATELLRQGLDPREVASPTDPRGRWLRELPFAARIGRWLFAHSGDTRGRTLAELEEVLRPAVDAHDFDHPEVRGRRSILRSVDWHEDAPERVEQNAAAAGVDHIVFGHDPHALGHYGRIATADEGALVRIDTGVDSARGAMIRIRTRGTRTETDVLHLDGRVVRLH